MIHNRFWQAIFALAPLLCIFIAVGGYLIFIMSMLTQTADLEYAAESNPMAFLGGIGIFLALIFLAVGLSIGSLVFYIVHAVRNPNLQQNNLLLVWILLFVFANGIGQLIYWIIEILNKRPKAP